MKKRFVVCVLSVAALSGAPAEGKRNGPYKA